MSLKISCMSAPDQDFIELVDEGDFILTRLKTYSSSVTPTKIVNLDEKRVRVLRDQLTNWLDRQSTKVAVKFWEGSL